MSRIQQVVAEISVIYLVRTCLCQSDFDVKTVREVQ